MDARRRILSIDLEIYSDVDLGNCGVYRYVEGDFHILLFAYAFDDDEVRVVDMACGEQLPKEVRDAIFDENIIAYYVINNNMGYDGDLELALIPESFREDVLQELKDTNGVLIETADAEIVHFALLFEFDGDQRHIRHVMYNCSASRPGIEGKTNEESREVQTETLSLKATPLPDGTVKAKTGDETDNATYTGWYDDVYLPYGGGDETSGSDTP